MKRIKSLIDEDWLCNFVFPLLTVLFAGSLIFILKAPYSQNADMHWHQAQADAILEWNNFSLDLSANPLYSFGTQLPQNPYLSPAFLISSFFPVEFRIPIVGGIQALLLMLILIQICRMCGLKRGEASAVSLVALTYLYAPHLTSGGALPAQALLGLLWQDGTIAALLTSLFFLKIENKKSLWPITGMFLTVLWFFVAHTGIAPFFVFATGALGVGVFFTSRNKEELKYKFLAILGLGITLLLLGFHRTFKDTFDYTPQMFFETLKQISYSQLFWEGTSILVHPLLSGYATKKFFVLSLIGAVLTWKYGSKNARRFVTIAIVFEFMIFLTSVANAMLKKFVMSFFYVELMGIALLALLAGVTWWALAAFISKKIKKYFSKAPDTAFKVAPLAILFVICSGWALKERDVPTLFSWPPNKSSEIVQEIIKRGSIRPGEMFRGRTVILLDSPPDPFSRTAYIYSRDLRYNFLTDLMADGVLLENQYGHWISPSTLANGWLAYGDPQKNIERSARPLMNFRPNLARLFGTSLVITDRPLSNEKQIFSGKAEDIPIYLYEIAKTNLGNFSPAKIVVAKNAKEIFDHLQKPVFDGEELALTEEEMDTNLVPASDVSVVLEKGPKIHVKATSLGTSLLVLPFDFSFCLKPEGSGFKKLLPVNLSQIGLIVEGTADVKIGYHYGVFKGTSCRRKDIDRLKSMDLENSATGRLFLDQRNPN